MKKKIGKILLWTLIIIVALVVIVVLSLNPLVKGITETAVPILTKSPVTLGKCNISLLGASVNLDSFILGNPEGYETDHAIAFNRIYVDLDKSTLFNDVIVVNTVLIDGMSIVLEQGLTENNISKIISNLKSSSKSADAQEEAAEDQAEAQNKEEPKEAKKIVIRKIMVTNASVSISAKGLGGNALPIPLPPITLTNVGGDPDKDPDGVTLAQAIEEFLNAILESAGKIGIDVGDLSKTVLDSAKILGDQAGAALKNSNEALKGTGDALKGTGDETIKAVDDLTKGIKDLF